VALIEETGGYSLILRDQEGYFYEGYLDCPWPILVISNTITFFEITVSAQQLYIPYSIRSAFGMWDDMVKL
jgi:hypothetical protein